MFEILKSLLGLGANVAKSFGDQGKEERAAQSRLNEAEISGAPNSFLRLWRSALGWALALSFIWEVMARPVIVTYWPEAVLPPSFIRETTSLLLGMLGLGI